MYYAYFIFMWLLLTFIISGLIIIRYKKKLIGSSTKISLVVLIGIVTFLVYLFVHIQIDKHFVGVVYDDTNSKYVQTYKITSIDNLNDRVLVTNSDIYYTLDGDKLNPNPLTKRRIVNINQIQITDGLMDTVTIVKPQYSNWFLKLMFGVPSSICDRYYFNANKDLVIMIKGEI